jgi:hypothetical protein
MGELERRHEEAAEEIHADRVARDAEKNEPSWRPRYKRLFNRS